MRWEYAWMFMSAQIDTDTEPVIEFSHRERETMKRWPPLVALLHRLGDEGWELVTVQSRGIYSVYWFKRPL